MPALRKRPAAARRKPGLRLISKLVGVDAWNPYGKVLHIRGCATDVYLEKRTAGNEPQRKLPTAHAGKGGTGRIELRAPQGMPQPWAARPYWHRVVAWFFAPKVCRPPGLTLEAFFAKNGQSYNWVALVGASRGTWSGASGLQESPREAPDGPQVAPSWFTNGFEAIEISTRVVK